MTAFLKYNGAFKLSFFYLIRAFGNFNHLKDLSPKALVR